LMLALFVVAGVAGSALLPVRVARGGRELAFLTLATGTATVCCVVLAVIPGLTAGLLVVLALGVILLPTLPVVLAMVERRAVSSAATAAALVWMSGNAGGLVVAVAVQLLVHRPSWAFALLAVAAGLGCLLSRSSRLRSPAPAIGPESLRTPGPSA
ncbi:MAG: MFS transporter, partial [Nocardioidaceae bacterium]